MIGRIKYIVVVVAVSGGGCSAFLFSISYFYHVVVAAANPSGCHVLLPNALSATYHCEGVAVFVFCKSGMYDAAVM